MQALLKPWADPKAIWQGLGVPVIAVLLFLALWAGVAPRIQTSLGAIPGPVQVADQAWGLWQAHLDERDRAVAFYERQDKRNAERLAEDPSYEPRNFKYTGKATYLDQIVTSLLTVFTGFLLGTVVAVPLGIAAGASKLVQAAINRDYTLVLGCVLIVALIVAVINLLAEAIARWIDPRID